MSGIRSDTNSSSEIRHLRLDDVEHRNPVTPGFLDELTRCIEEEPAVVLISAAEGPVFSSGGDLRLGPDRLRELSDSLYMAYEKMIVSPTVFVVAANGLAMGAGAQLVLAADIRLAGERFSIRFSDLDTGLAAGMWALPAEIGRGRSLYLLLTGRTLDVAEAVRLGLVDLVAEPMEEAERLASKIARLPSSWRERIKRIVASASIAETFIRSEAASFEPPSPRCATDE